MLLKWVERTQVTTDWRQQSENNNCKKAAGKTTEMIPPTFTIAFALLVFATCASWWEFLDCFSLCSCAVVWMKWPAYCSWEGKPRTYDICVCVVFNLPRLYKERNLKYVYIEYVKIGIGQSWEWPDLQVQAINSRLQPLIIHPYKGQL